MDLVHFDDLMRVRHPMGGRHLALMVHQRAREIPSDSLGHHGALPSPSPGVPDPVYDLGCTGREPERVGRS